MADLRQGSHGGTASAVIPLTMAWVGDEIPLPRRQAVLAKLLTFIVFGMMTGAWAGGALTEAFGWRWVFVAEGAALLAAAVAILIRGPRNRSDRTLQAGSQIKNAGAILRNSTARRIYAVVLFEGALVFGVLAFVPSLLHERFKLPLTESGAILAAFGLGGFGAAWMLGRTRLPLLACAGAGLLCIAFVTLSLMPHWGWSLPACLLAGLGFYLLHGTLQTCATQISISARGTAVSMFSCAIFLGQSAGVAGMGIAITNDLADQCIAMAAAILLALGLRFAYWLRLNPLGRGDAR